MGFLGVPAVGLSFPQAFTRITTNRKHGLLIVIEILTDILADVAR